MYYFPNSNMVNDWYGARQLNSYIRILNASPDAPALDIYANGNLIIQNLPYKSMSQYITVPSGTYNIKIYPAGQKTNPVLDETLSIPPNAIFTIAAVGILANIALFSIPEPITAQNMGAACIRFVHLAPTTPAVDLTLSDGRMVFNNVVFKEISTYACVPQGTYTFQVYPKGTKNLALTIPNLQLQSNNYYTIYLVGSPANKIPLEAVVYSEPR